MHCCVLVKPKPGHNLPCRCHGTYNGDTITVLLEQDLKFNFNSLNQDSCHVLCFRSILAWYKTPVTEDDLWELNEDEKTKHIYPNFDKELQELIKQNLT